MFGGCRIQYSTGVSLDWSNDCLTIDSHRAAGYALCNGSDLPVGHAHPGWSRLRAQFRSVCRKAEVCALPPSQTLPQRDRMKKSIGISPNIETLFGTRDENVRLLEDGLNITIDLRSNAIELEGASRDVARAEQIFADYESLHRSGYSFNNGDLNSMLRVLTVDSTTTLRGLADAG